MNSSAHITRATLLDGVMEAFEIQIKADQSVRVKMAHC